MCVHGPYDRSGAQGCASYVFCGAYANVCLKVLGRLPCIFKCINVYVWSAECRDRGSGPSVARSSTAKCPTASYTSIWILKDILHALIEHKEHFLILLNRTTSYGIVVRGGNMERLYPMVGRCGSIFHRCILRFGF